MLIRDDENLVALEHSFVFGFGSRSLLSEAAHFLDEVISADRREPILHRSAVSLMPLISGMSSAPSSNLSSAQSMRADSSSVSASSGVSPQAHAPLAPNTEA